LGSLIVNEKGDEYKIAPPEMRKPTIIKLMNELAQNKTEAKETVNYAQKGTVLSTDNKPKKIR